MSLTVLDRERTVAGAGYNRWLVPPAALAVHLCIGQAYATSVYKASLVDHFDSSLTSVGIIFSIAIVMLGVSAALFGTWVDTGGPRRAMVASAAFWSTGFLVGSLGIASGQLWLVYVGYGFIGGIGLGLGYISPVSTLIKWFPDRPGLATGMAIMGFGGGAMIASPLSTWLLGVYDPSFDSATAIATGAAVAKLFVTLGLIYLVVMTFGAWLIRVPPEGWVPDGFDPHSIEEKPLVTTANVSAANAIKTPQFWLLWVVLFCNVTAGIGILEQAAPMIMDFFRDSDTSTVAAAAAAGFVGVLSLFNMAGRFVWSSTSDVVGRKNIYVLYLGAGMLLYLALTFVGPSSTFVFVILAGFIISFYGGGFATVPAYLRDLFGPYQVGAIHGRLLTAWSAAGVAGPLIINGILDTQGEPGSLTAADYRPALITMVCVLAVGFTANLMIKPVDSRFHEPEPDRAASDPTAAGVDGVAADENPVPSFLLPVAWLVVGVPLAYGVYETVSKAIDLFG
jgi:MFS family permease